MRACVYGRRYHLQLFFFFHVTPGALKAPWQQKPARAASKSAVAFGKRRTKLMRLTQVCAERAWINLELSITGGQRRQGTCLYM